MPKESYLRTIEINGVKLEIDLRDAKAISQYKIGSPVKVLVKKYGDSYTSCAGVIVGFDDFKDLPTINICYIDPSQYQSSPVMFACINAKSKDVEIAPADDIAMVIDKARVLDLLERDIVKKEEETRDVKNRRLLFLKYFGRFIMTQDETKPEERQD